MSKTLFYFIWRTDLLVPGKRKERAFLRSFVGPAASGSLHTDQKFCDSSAACGAYAGPFVSGGIPWMV